MMKGKKNCLITGATSGIGKEAAIELARQGMHIIMNTRNEEKGKQVRDEIINLTGNPDVSLYYGDLSSFRSIIDFAGMVKKNHDHLDILINNAGIWPKQKIKTVDGIEQTFAVNHLAPLLLTHLLMDTIRKSGAGRIINVSSGIHYLGYIDTADPEFNHKPYRSFKAYGQSKLANVLFTRDLASQLKETNITVNCLAPGWVNTGLFRESGAFVKSVARKWAITPAKGAETTVFLATSEQVSNISGEYFEKKRKRTSARKSYNKKLMNKLRMISEEYLKEFLN